MAEPLKLFFDGARVRRIAAMLRAADPGFAERKFTAEATRGLDDLELVDRGRHIASVMARHLPRDFGAAADLLVRSLGPELERTEDNGMAPFLYLPHVLYVAEHGLADFDAAMRAQHALTRRFSAEYSIRVFLAAEQTRTLAVLEGWAGDANVHVRRLVSEGTRPRLPWAPRLPAFQQDPALILPLLERLRDDPELYVRRSVANNLNDIGKDHPELLVEVCRRWMRGAPEPRRWVVKHALRWLAKRGHAGALAVLGFDADPRIRVEDATVTPRRARMGATVRYRAVLRNTALRDGDEQELHVDAVVHFASARGAPRPRVFKLGVVTLAPRGRAEVGGEVKLRDLTTRKHHSGRHLIELRVNGKDFPLGHFDLIP